MVCMNGKMQPWYVQVSHVRTVIDKIQAPLLALWKKLERRNPKDVESMIHFKEKEKTIKPHLQSSKVGVLVSPCCHVCDNAHEFSIVLIIAQLLLFL